MSAEDYPYVLRRWAEVAKDDHVLWNGEPARVVAEPGPAEGKPDIRKVPVWLDSTHSGFDALVIADHLTAVMATRDQTLEMLNALAAEPAVRDA